MRYRMRVGGVALGLAMLVALAVGCGKASPSSGASPAPGGDNSFQAYISCLAQHGVNLQMPSGRPSGVRPSGVRPSGGFPSGVRPSGARPSGGPGGGFPGGGFGGAFQKPADVSQATWDAAQQACASVRPSFGAGAGNRGGDNGASAAYRNCLSQHGVTASGTGALNTADPKVAAAERACAPLRPSVTPTPTS